MSDAGSIYYNTLSGIGNDIAQSMYQVHREHQAYDQQYGMAEALSRIGIDSSGRIVPIVPDEKGKTDKSIQPIVDPKALEMFKTGNRREWARSAGQLEILSRLGTSFLNRAQAAQIENQQNPKYDVTTPAGRTIPTSAAGAIASDIHAQSREDALAAGKQRAELAGRREQREIDTAKREDIRLALSQQKAKQDALEKTPEYQFQKKYNIKPLDVVGMPEGYNATDEAGNVLDSSSIEDRKAGKKPILWTPTTPVYREKLFKYAATKDRPGFEQYVPDPEGEFFNAGGQRLPYKDVSAIQKRAGFVYKQALEAAAQGGDVKGIATQIQQLGYDPDLFLKSLNQ